MDEEGKEKESEQRDAPVTISLGKLLGKLQSLPLAEKLFCYGGIIYLAGSTLPWSSSPERPGNGWTISSFQDLANLALLAGWALQVGGLAGIGPGLNQTVLRVLRYSTPAAGLLVLLKLPSHPGLGLLLAAAGVALHGLGLYKILDARSLLPMKFTK